MSPHVKNRLEEREIGLYENLPKRLARRCNGDTALILQTFDTPRSGYGGTNGEIVVLIVRNQFPVTIFYRRKNQPFTPEALRVECVNDVQNLIGE